MIICIPPNRLLDSHKFELHAYPWPILEVPRTLQIPTNFLFFTSLNIARMETIGSFLKLESKSHSSQILTVGSQGSEVPVWPSRSILCCVVQKFLEICKCIPSIHPSSTELISDSLRISSLSVALTPLHPSKYVPRLCRHRSACIDGATPVALQAFQPFYPCPDLNQLERDVKGK